VARAAAVIDALIALEALGAVEHPVEHPGIGVVMHAAGPTRHPHHGVDHKTVRLIDMEQEILAALGRGPSRRMSLEAEILHQGFQQRLGPVHAAPVVGLGRPDRPQIVDEFFEHRQV
jgi:hypothetical protein